jgi:penicillin-binding protein 1A
MRAAHQGVPVAMLPNMQAPSGGLTTLTQIASQITGPTPPAVQGGPGRPAPGRAPVRPEPAAGLDGWLMDRLFGGRR